MQKIRGKLNFRLPLLAIITLGVMAFDGMHVYEWWLYALVFISCVRVERE